MDKLEDFLVALVLFSQKHFVTLFGCDQMIKLDRVVAIMPRRVSTPVLLLIGFLVNQQVLRCLAKKLFARYEPDLRVFQQLLLGEV